MESESAKKKTTKCACRASQGIRPQIRVLAVDLQRVSFHVPFCPARGNLILDYERLFNFMNTKCLIISFDFAYFFT